MLGRRKFSAALVIAALALAARPAAPAETGEKKKGGGVSYIQFQTLTATVIHANGQRGVMTVEAGVDVPDAGLRAKADLSMPRLRAAYVRLLVTYASGLAPGSPPDADYLARALQDETDRVLGRRGARFLIGTVLIN